MSFRRVGAVVPILALIVAACSGGSSPSASTAAAGCMVGVSWNNYQQERWKKADEPAIQKAITAGGGSYIRTDARDNAEQQLADVDSLINQGAKALIILAKDSDAILPAIAKAKSAGIPVIAYDRLIEDTDAFYITFDNQKVGTLMAEVITKLVPKGNYVIIKGNKADPNADFLRAGMDVHLKPLVDSGAVKIVYEDYTDDWDTTNAKNNMETALNKANNDVQAVLSENDSMATGVVAALADVGLAGTVPVSGQDGDTVALNRVALGTQSVSVWKNASALGETAGSVAIQLCGGTKLADAKAPSGLPVDAAPAAGVGAQPFTTPGGKTVQSIILTPTPVTKANLKLPVDSGWVTKEQVCAGVKAGDVADVCG